MKNRVKMQWVVAPEPDFRLVDDIAQKVNLPPLVVKILVSRNMTDPVVIDKFINPNMSDLVDPFLIPGMEAGVERTIQALQENETIMIYGDYDVDGITAASLMFLVLNKLGANVHYYLPNRLVEGYGLSEEGIIEAERKGASLIISVDTGITAGKEVEYAKEKFIDCVITDHHEPGETLPNAAAVVNPKLGPSIGRELAGVGVAFKFAQGLYSRLGQDQTELYEHLDLVALGTSADVVPLVNENRILTSFGIGQIMRSSKPGLKSLVFECDLMGKEITTSQIVFIIAPRINAVGRLGGAEKAIKLLTTKDTQTASSIAKFLEIENRRRKSIDENTLEEALGQIEKSVDLENDKAIVLHSEGWHQGVIGIVASRLVEKYYLPTVLIAVDNNEGKGSGRSIPGFHLHDALKSCEDLLLRYGGHKYAAGMSIAPERIKEFQQRFKRVAATQLNPEDLIRKLHIDAELDLDDIDFDLVDTLERFAPFGPENMKTVFITRNLEIVGSPQVVGRNHLRMRVRSGRKVFDVIGFGFGDYAEQLSMHGVDFDMAYVIEKNIHNGVTKIQLRVKDIRWS
ncbi:MAG: single-stranded-DNA-specific exonuclease RecJ [bacterium]|nr:single-stranded-DNA-specific exonuclease RecJ [bacterium]